MADAGRRSYLAAGHRDSELMADGNLVRDFGGSNVLGGRR
jgi:hypothetical protein